MDHIDNLKKRLELMVEAEMISGRTMEFCLEAARMILEEKSDVDSERMNMAMTHLAMSAGRMERGETEEIAIGTDVFKQVENEPCFSRACRLGRRILDESPVPFTDTEKDFLTIHLCSLLM